MFRFQLKGSKEVPTPLVHGQAPSRRPKLYIVNLQWTPKDDWAALKLHGKCDDVMRLLMDELGLEIPLQQVAGPHLLPGDSPACG